MSIQKSVGKRKFEKEEVKRKGTKKRTAT